MSVVMEAVAFLKANVKSWLSETTTAIGAVLIMLGGWEFLAGALTSDQALGLVTAGVALLYPQSSAKQQATVAVVSQVLSALEAAKDPTKQKDSPS